jgi:hypothetical protein
MTVPHWHEEPITRLHNSEFLNGISPLRRVDQLL